MRRRFVEAYHEADEEVRGGVLARPNKLRPIPEHQRDDEEDHSLRERIERIAVQRSTVGAGKRGLKRSAVGVEAVLLSSERSDGLDRTSSFASDLGGFLMRSFVGLILEDDDTL